MVEKSGSYEGPSGELILATLTSTQDALTASVDSFRNRALSYATLVATIAGALTAGFIFSDIGSNASTLVRFFGVSGIAILLISFILYVTASQRVKRNADTETIEPKDNGESTGGQTRYEATYLRDGSSNSASKSGWKSLEETINGYYTEAQDEMRSIRQITAWGNIFGVLAIVLIIGAIVFGTLSSRYEEMKISTNVFSDEVRTMCTDLGKKTEVLVDVSKLATPNELIPVELSGEKCSADLMENITVLLPKRDLTMWKP